MKKCPLLLFVVMLSGCGLGKKAPETLVSESCVLKEGEYKAYSFNLTYAAKVSLSLTANPERVNVVLLDANEYVQFHDAKKKLFGGSYNFKTAISSQDVTTLNSSADLDVRTWYLVVERPAEHLLKNRQATTNVSVSLTAQQL